MAVPISPTLYAEEIKARVSKVTGEAWLDQKMRYDEKTHTVKYHVSALPEEVVFEPGVQLVEESKEPCQAKQLFNSG